MSFSLVAAGLWFGMGVAVVLPFLWARRQLRGWISQWRPPRYFYLLLTILPLLMGVLAGFGWLGQAPLDELNGRLQAHLRLSDDPLNEPATAPAAGTLSQLPQPLVEELKAAYRRWPENLRLQRLLGEWKLRSGDLSGGLELLSPLVQDPQQDGEADLLLSVAEAHLLMADPQAPEDQLSLGELEAYQLLRRAHSLQPERPDLLLLLAQLDRRQGKGQAASSWLDRGFTIAQAQPNSQPNSQLLSLYLVEMAEVELLGQPDSIRMAQLPIHLPDWWPARQQDFADCQPAIQVLPAQPADDSALQLPPVPIAHRSLSADGENKPMMILLTARDALIPGFDLRMAAMRGIGLKVALACGTTPFGQAEVAAGWHLSSLQAGAAAFTSMDWKKLR